MRVYTAVGEQGLTLPDGRSIVFRPSLYAMSQLGSPREIVQLLADIHEQPYFIEPFSFDPESQKALAAGINKKIAADHWFRMLTLSWQVMHACADSDPKAFIGEPGEGYKSYRLGAVPAEVMLVIARSLLRHGLVGPYAEKSREQIELEIAENENRKGMIEFSAIDYVSKAVAHLGMSESEAWNMTLTSFGAHWAAKFGENKEKRHSEEHDATMNWLAAVNKMRDKQK